MVLKWMARCLLSAALAAGIASPGRAQVTFSGSSGDLSASAIFGVMGGNLLIRLSNTSTGDVTQPGEVLTGIFFNLRGADQLSRISAFLPSDSRVLWGPVGANGNVGGEWAYAGGLRGGPQDTHHGISTAGLGLFSPSDLFPGGNLSGQTAIGGLDYGITSIGDDITSGNTAVTGGKPLIQYQVDFTLGGLPSAFSLDDIGDVWFQYGTSLNEGGFQGRPPSPEPGAMAFAVGAGVVCSGAWLRTRRRRRAGRRGA